MGLLVAAAACNKTGKKEAAPDFNKCDYPPYYDRIDGKGVPPGYDGEIFGVGDTPEDSYTSLEGHVAPRCEFVEGPNLKKQADGSLTTIAEGEVTGKCGSATTKYLVRKVAKVVASKGTSIGGIGALTEPFTVDVGKERTAYGVRLDSCDRYIRSRGAGNVTWKLGTCAGIVEAANAQELATPTESLSVRGVKAGTCELEMTTAGISAKFPITVTGGDAAGSAAGSAAQPASAPAGGNKGGGDGAPAPTRGAKSSSDPEEGGEKK
jgi:hypothetical protein